MERVCERLDDISFDARPIHRKAKNLILFLDTDILYKSEHCFDEYEKVSFSFLFFDDVLSCLNICEKCVNNSCYSFMSTNSIKEYSNWEEKFVECVFYLQNYSLLIEMGIGIYDAKNVFKRPKFVSKLRLLLYKICENLSNAETTQLMESITSISSEKYLEMFILKILSLDNGLDILIPALLSLNNPVIHRFLSEIEECTNVKYDFELQEKSNLLSRPVNVSQEIYPIKDPNNVGLCFVLNIVNVKGETTREGSDEDVKAIKSTMKYFNIDVIVFDDVDKKFFEDLSANVDIYFKEKKYSVFFLIILSHGIPDAIYTSDAKAVHINFITLKLACKSLQKIPKVLIIQACQGELLLLKDLATDGPSSVECDQVPKTPFKFGRYISDFLLAMSTVNGFKAFRDTKKGSWFVQAFCKCMKDLKDEDILSIITKTIAQVKANSVPATDDHQLVCTQQPEMRSVLEKKLYLKPIINN